jgi:hypothetical protein
MVAVLGVMACSFGETSEPAARSDTETASDDATETASDTATETASDTATETVTEAETVSDPAIEAPTEPVTALVGTREVRVAAPSHPVPSDAPHAILHVPSRAERETVVFLHGWSGCVRVLAHDGALACARRHRREPGWNLLAAARSSRARWLFPQLSFRARDGSPGRFREPAFARAYLDELGLSEGPIVLTAHSAGFETALAWLRSDVRDRIRAVVLFDGLYAGAHAFADWALERPDRRLVSYVIGQGGTRRENERLRAYVSARGAAVGDSLEHDAPVRIVEGRAAHGDLPARHLEEVLRALER